MAGTPHRRASRHGADRRRIGLCVRPREVGIENRRGEISSTFRCRQDHHSNRRLTAFLPPLFLLLAPYPRFVSITVLPLPALPCIALYCIDSSEHQVPSEMTGGGDRCVRCVHGKAMCVARGRHARHVCRRVGIPQLRHSWTLSDKVFQGGRLRGSLGVDDEVWSVQMQGLLVSPSRTETATGDSKMHIMSCTVDTVLYSSVQSRTFWRHCRLPTSPPCDTTPYP